MVDVKGRWALVTGAARGIGYGAALFLAEHGCNLVLHGRTKDHCQKVLEKVKEFGVEAYVVGAEFSDLSQVEDMLREIDILGIDIDIVLNNAGIQVAYRNEYLLTPASDYEESFKINTIAPMMIAYHFLPLMEKRGFGRIVNTTSGIRLEPQQAGYSASKAALDKVTMDLAAQYEGTNVCINITDPGWCRTDLGGSSAPNDPASSLPGVVVGAFIDDKKSGRNFSAGEFAGMSLEDAVKKAENGFPIYTGSVAYPDLTKQEDTADATDTAEISSEAMDTPEETDFFGNPIEAETDYAEKLRLLDDAVREEAEKKAREEAEQERLAALKAASNEKVYISKKELIALIDSLPSFSGPDAPPQPEYNPVNPINSANTVNTITPNYMLSDQPLVPHSANKKYEQPVIRDPEKRVKITNCPDCGRYIPSGTPFCPHCRSVLVWTKG